MTAPAAIGVDIGGTKVLAVALDDAHDVVAEHRVPTPKDPEALTRAIVDAVEALGRPVASLGIGIAGLVTVTGHVRVSPHLAEPERLDLRGRLGDHFGVEVRVDNDANAACWGEARLGAGRGSQDLVVVTLGTGIGAGIVCNGRLVRGAHGFAGEPGHHVVNFDGDPHVTGRPGEWELYASGTALRTGAGRVLAPADLTGADGAAVLDGYADMVAIGVANLVDLLDPEVVVIGGGVSELGEPLRAAIEARLGAWVFGAGTRPPVRLVLAALGERAGAIGAALLGAGR